MAPCESRGELFSRSFVHAAAYANACHAPVTRFSLLTVVESDSFILLTMTRVSTKKRETVIVWVISCVHSTFNPLKQESRQLRI